MTIQASREGIMARNHDRYGKRIDETNIERNGVSDYEMVMGDASPEDYGGSYEDAARQAENAWDEIVRGYFSDLAQDFDLDAIHGDYVRRTVLQAAAGGWFYEDMSTDALNKLAQQHERGMA